MAGLPLAKVVGVPDAIPYNLVVRFVAVDKLASEATVERTEGLLERLRACLGGLPVSELDMGRNCIPRC